jgi:hypothetical protein
MLAAAAVAVAVVAATKARAGAKSMDQGDPLKVDDLNITIAAIGAASTESICAG